MNQSSKEFYFDALNRIFSLRVALLGLPSHHRKLVQVAFCGVEEFYLKMKRTIGTA